MTTTSPLPLPRAARAPLSVAALKRADCLGFTRLGSFPATERALWDDWATQLWRADELAETDPVAFARLRAYWEEARLIGPPGQQRVADAWSRYLAALADYHRPGLVIRTLAEHDEMLLRLSGPLLQLAPGVPESLWDSAYAFGAMDQFYNNLRDLQEDAARGLCWFPEEVLRHFGFIRRDVLSGDALKRSKWPLFMEFWLGEHARMLRDAAAQLRDTEELSPSLLAMRSWTVRRHARTARALRAVDYDYRRFPDVYWPEVRRELGESEMEMQ